MEGCPDSLWKEQGSPQGPPARRVLSPQLLGAVAAPGSQLRPSGSCPQSQEAPFLRVHPVPLVAHIQYLVEGGRNRRAPGPFPQGRMMLKGILAQEHGRSPSSSARPWGSHRQDVLWSAHLYPHPCQFWSQRLFQEVLPTITGSQR